MAVLPQQGEKTGRRREIEAVLAELPHVLFFFLVLPLTLILSMIPGSWGEAAGYADLGEVDFVASEVDLRVRRHSPRGHSVIYRATDGSGLSFREAGTRQSARAAVEEQQHLRRHVYISLEKPNAVLRLFRYTTGRVFLPPEEDFQAYLDGSVRLQRLGKAAGAGYGVVYVSLMVRRWRRRQE